MGEKKMAWLPAVDCEAQEMEKERKIPVKQEVQKVRRRKTSDGRNTVTTMNHHISNCDWNYLQFVLTATHK